MKMLTKDDINALKPMEVYFRQIRQNYKRASSVKEDTIVSEIYTRLTGKVEKNFACGKCSYEMYKTVGDAYWQALKEVGTLESTTDDTKKTKPTTKKTVKRNGQRRVKAKKD